MRAVRFFPPRWPVWFRLVSLALLAGVVAAIQARLERLGVETATIEASAQRCLIDTQGGWNVDGFTRASRCILSGADRVDLGAGELRFEGGRSLEGFDWNLRLARRHASSAVVLSSPDLAVGYLRTQASRVDIRVAGEDEFRLSVSNDAHSTVRGNLSLGDTCAIRATGYSLYSGEKPVDSSGGTTMRATFVTRGGAGAFEDTTDVGCQLTVPDHGGPRKVALAGRRSIAGIRFLNDDDECAGVDVQTIRVGKGSDTVGISENSCLRVAADTLTLNELHLGADSRLAVSLSGSFRSIDLDDAPLVDEPWPALVLLGLLGFAVFAGVVLGVERLVDRQ